MFWLKSWKLSTENGTLKFLASVVYQLAWPESIPCLELAWVVVTLDSWAWVESPVILWTPIWADSCLLDPLLGLWITVPAPKSCQDTCYQQNWLYSAYAQLYSHLQKSMLNPYGCLACHDSLLQMWFDSISWFEIIWCLACHCLLILWFRVLSNYIFYRQTRLVYLDLNVEILYYGLA